MQDETLKPQEWLGVLFFLTISFSLGLLAYISSVPEIPTVDPEPHFVASQVLTIQVSGAIANPGSYSIPKGSTLKDLLALVELLPEADISKLDPAKPLRKGLRVKIPSKKKPKAKPKPNKPKKEKTSIVLISPCTINTTVIRLS